jgi:hypothetical protein
MLAGSIPESQALDKLCALTSSAHSSARISLLRRQAGLFIARGHYSAAKSALLEITTIDPLFMEPWYTLSTFSKDYGIALLDEESGESRDVVSNEDRKEYALKVIESTGTPRQYSGLISLGSVYKREGKICIPNVRYNYSNSSHSSSMVHVLYLYIVFYLHE